MADEFDLSAYVTKPEALSDPQMLMFVGPPGGGKTWLAASASEVEGLYPVLIIDLEGSTQGTLIGLDQDRIDVIRVQERFSPKDVYPKTIAILEGLLNKQHKYKTVIIDTADVLQEFAAAYGSVDGDGFAKWSFVHSELTAPPAYRKDGKMVDRGLFHRLKSANFLAILVVHDRQEYDGDGTLVRDTFQWSGQGKTKLGGIPDLIGIVTRKTSGGKGRSTMNVGSSTRATSKNRYEAVLSAKIEEPTLAEVYGKIRGASNKKEDQKHGA